MEMKNLVKIEVEIEDRVYSLECLPESPLGELHSALSQMLNFVVQKIVDAQPKIEECKVECHKDEADKKGVI